MQRNNGAPDQAGGDSLQGDGVLQDGLPKKELEFGAPPEVPPTLDEVLASCQATARDKKLELIYLHARNLIRGKGEDAAVAYLFTKRIKVR